MASRGDANLIGQSSVSPYTTFLVVYNVVVVIRNNDDPFRRVGRGVSAR